MGSINKCEIIDGQKVLTPFVQTNSIEDYYTTEEEATNKVWIDGKRIYRKVFVSESDSISVNTHLETPYIDMIVNQGVLYRRIPKDSCTPIVYKHGTGETAYITLRWCTGGEFSNSYSWWVEYTKTTD